jgi:hypothetical protein
MGRSGYSDDCSYLELWRGAVERAIHGKRGQTFLREMLAALDALPAPRLIDEALHEGSEVCAIGSVGLRRGVDMSKMDPYDHDALSAVFGIATSLVMEIEWINDDGAGYSTETPENRFKRVRAWVIEQLPHA